MPIELKDFSKFLDIEITDETTNEQLTEAFNAKYVPVETHSKALGELNGQVQHAIKKSFKEIGLEVGADELKDKTTKDLPSIFANAAKAKFSELESQKGATAEEIEKKYQSDFEKLKTSLKDKETLLTDVQTQFEGFKTNVEKEKRNHVIHSEFSKSFGSLKFSESIHELAKEGFKAKLSTQYQFDINEDGQHIVKDVNGNLVPSKAKAGSPASYEEVITTAFKESGLEQVVNPNKTATFAPTPVAVTPSTNSRTIAPRHN
jgi:molybdopterin converting factor small subunit